MPAEFIDFLQTRLGPLTDSVWLHQLGILLAATLLAWPFSIPLARRFRKRADEVAPTSGRAIETVYRVVAVSGWPVLAIGLTAAASQLWRRFAGDGLGEQDLVLPLLVFFLAFRVVNALIRAFVVAGPRRRRIRRGLMPVLFLLMVLQQIGLLGPLLKWMQQPLLTLSEVPISLISVLTAVALSTSVILLARVLSSILGQRVLPGFGIEASTADVIATVVRYVLVVAGLIWGVELLGFDLTSIKIIFGALGVGIGFGLQTVVNNFVSGLILLFERTVKRGDVLTVEGTDGRVQSVGLRASVLRTREGDDLIMPNSILASNTVTNYSFRDRLKRVDVDIGVTYSADPDQVREILLEVARTCEDILTDPEPSVLFLQFGESSIDFQLRGWIDDAWKVPQVRSHLLFDIWYALKGAGIEIPFPQRDLHVRSGVLPIRRAEEAVGGD